MYETTSIENGSTDMANLIVGFFVCNCQAKVCMKHFF